MLVAVSFFLQTAWASIYCCAEPPAAAAPPSSGPLSAPMAAPLSAAACPPAPPSVHCCLWPPCFQSLTCGAWGEEGRSRGRAAGGPVDSGLLLASALVGLPARTAPQLSSSSYQPTHTPHPPGSHGSSRPHACMSRRCAAGPPAPACRRRRRPRFRRGAAARLCDPAEQGWWYALLRRPGRAAIWQDTPACWLARTPALLPYPQAAHQPPSGTLTARGAQQARLQLRQQGTQLAAPFGELRQAGGRHPGGQRRLSLLNTLQQLAYRWHASGRQSGTLQAMCCTHGPATARF